MAEAFRIFDTKGDGCLDEEEVKAAFDLLGIPYDDWEVICFINDGDKNENHIIDYEGKSFF